MQILDSYSKSAVAGCSVMAKTDTKKENSETAKETKEDEAAKPVEEEKPEKQEIEKLKFSVEKLSEELNTAVAELKRSIIDIRSAVSEIENPFNLLRVITSEKDLERIKSEKLPPGVKSLYIGKPKGKAGERAEKKEGEEVTTPAQAPTPVEAHKVEVLEEKKPEAAPKTELLEEHPGAERLQRGTAYLNWVWSLLDAGFTPEDIKQLSQSYEELGFLPEGCSGQIYSLAVAAEKAKSRGLTKSKLLLNMYKASIISGIGIGLEDVKRLIAMAEKRSVREKASRRAE